METKSVELEEAGIEVVKINDKKTSKSFGILSAPGLTYFKGGKGENFEGELTDPEELMDFLASPEAMELPDQIEEVNAKQLDKLVVEKMFVAVLFCKLNNDTTNTCLKALVRRDLSPDTFHNILVSRHLSLVSRHVSFYTCLLKQLSLPY